MQHLLALRPKAVNYLKGFQAWLHSSIWTFQRLRIHALQMLSRWLWSSREIEHASHWAPVKCVKPLQWPYPEWSHLYTQRCTDSLAHLHAVPLGTRSLFWYSFKHLYWLTVPLSGVWEDKGKLSPYPMTHFESLRQGWLLLSLLWVYALIIKL